MPVKLAVCGLLAALSARLKVAVSAPTIDGVKAMPTEQALPGSTVALLQLFETVAKSATFVPENVTEPAAKATVVAPLLETLMVCTPLVIWTS